MGTNLIKKVENTNNPSRGIGGIFRHKICVIEKNFVPSRRFYSK